MEQVELDNAEQKVGSYLNVMVTNDGSDFFCTPGLSRPLKARSDLRCWTRSYSSAKQKRCYVAC